MHVQKLMLGGIGGCHLVIRALKQSALQIVAR